VRSLSKIFIESLIPSAALLGVLFAFYRRKQPTTFRIAMLWLALFVGSIMLPIWLAQWLPFNEPLVLASISAFAFVCPPGVHYWLRFQRPSDLGHIAFAKTLVVTVLVLLGIFWAALVWTASLAIIKKVWNAFQ
jgi:hypothetical protein